MEHPQVAAAGREEKDMSALNAQNSTAHGGGLGGRGGLGLHTNMEERSMGPGTILRGQEPCWGVARALMRGTMCYVV